MKSLIKNGKVDNFLSILPENSKESTNSTMPVIEVEFDTSMEIEKLKLEARNLGYNEGKKEAERELAHEREQLVTEFSLLKKNLLNENKQIQEGLLSATKELKSYCTDINNSAEVKMIALVLECLYKLVGQQKVYKDVVEESVKRCLAKNTFEEHIYIHFSSDSQEELQSINLSLEKNCTVVFDPDLRRGECIIKSGYKTFDFGLATQLEQIKERFLITLKEKRLND